MLPSQMLLFNMLDIPVYKWAKKRILSLYFNKQQSCNQFNSSDVLSLSCFLTSGCEFCLRHLQLQNASFWSSKNSSYKDAPIRGLQLMLDNHSWNFFQFINKHGQDLSPAYPDLNLTTLPLSQLDINCNVLTCIPWMDERSSMCVTETVWLPKSWTSVGSRCSISGTILWELDNSPDLCFSTNSRAFSLKMNVRDHS